MKIIVAIVAFFVVSWIASTFMGLFGLMSTLIGLLAAIAAYFMVGSPGNSRPAVAPSGDATFKWNQIEVHSAERVLYFNGEPIPFDKIRKIQYETFGSRGCFGGAAYHIHLYVDDMARPRRTMNVGNVFYKGNLETEENYERLRIALGIE